VPDPAHRATAEIAMRCDIEIQRLSDDETHTFTRGEVAARLERWMRPSDDIVHLAIGLVGRADNTRSARLFEGVGFVREGVMRESIHRDGQRVDELIFGLLRREWVTGQK
jgi:hypothetical protein